MNYNQVVRLLHITERERTTQALLQELIRLTKELTALQEQTVSLTIDYRERDEMCIRDRCKPLYIDKACTVHWRSLYEMLLTSAYLIMTSPKNNGGGYAQKTYEVLSLCREVY